MEQADLAFAVWKHFGLTGGHMLSHDMGDSVATEILARRENGLLPGWFSDDFKSLTFTNGSMVLDLAKLRSTQKLLLSSYGKMFSKIVSYQLFNRQIKGAQGNKNISEKDIELLWELNRLKDGNKKTHLTIKYLNDRKRYEKTRWLPALKETQIPVHICWGDVDAVARIAMAHYLKQLQPKAQLTIMKGLGHFCQLGSPEEWVKHVGAFYEGRV
ncbi:MAG: alpha/beta hydrolase [Bacteroidota bacterium]